jgi:hypothetical protein
MHTQDIQLPNGSIICWSRRNGRQIPVICGACGQERIVLNQLASQKVFTGIFYDCAYAAQRKYIENQVLENGTIVYWSERKGGRHEEIRFRCGVCGKERTMPALKVANPSFTGLCNPCARAGHRSHFWKGGRIEHPNGYILIRVTPDHPFYSMADSHNLIPEHRLKMAEHIGRVLEFDEIVHHKNGRKDDNRIENLELLKKNLHHTGYSPDEAALTEANLLDAIITLLKNALRI